MVWNLLFLEFVSLLLSSVEFVNAGSFEKSFFTSIEWVTFETGFYFEFFSLNGTECFKAVTARTDDLNLMGIWVDILFHRKKICRGRLIR